MASGTARRPSCRERSARERPGRRAGSAGRSRSRSGEREGEQRALRAELAAGDADCADGGEAKSPHKPRGSPGGAGYGHGESSANGAVPAPGAPRKRGRKSKAEMLLLELSQSPPPVPGQKGLRDSEEGDGRDTPGTGRPRRRAAKV
ncbi:general transcription factor 3C polypeptide 2 [Malurus melanocephalus]|uniref:general transcription factor 3C polypeptide 2 n=1 Tax=Malurus melanocephalus TaxID=175006 RepID=UPI0025497650|nr:general transcription factor 3C polypeptide 2 [Malurus melanocephalus]